MLMYESMCRLEFTTFLKWILDKEQLSELVAEELEVPYKNIQQAMKRFVLEERTQEKQQTVKENVTKLEQQLTNFSEHYDKSINEGKAASNTFHFWHDYVKDIELCLDYIASVKLPDWEKHLACCSQIFVCAFAYDHQNYARWGPVYIAEMLQLFQTDPTIYQ